MAKRTTARAVGAGIQRWILAVARLAGLWLVLLSVAQAEEDSMWLTADMAGKYLWCGITSSRPEWRYHTPSGKGRTVVLIHGLLHRAPMFEPLAHWLQQEHDCRVIFYDYPTTRYDVVEHAAMLADKLCELVVVEPGIEIDFITHSMGGIMLRLALSQLQEAGAVDFCDRVVMLAPPHHGSPKAESSLRGIPLAGRLVRPLADLSDIASGRIHTFPAPVGVSIGLIAGSRDRTVPVASTRLGALPHCQVAAGHCSILVNQAAWRQAWQFLLTGAFAPESNGKGVR